MYASPYNHLDFEVMVSLFVNVLNWFGSPLNRPLVANT